MSNFKEDLKKVKAFVFDVDGVFSRENVYLHPTGQLQRTMNTKDGYAVKQAVGQSFPLAIITGGVEESVRKRFQLLGVTDIYLGSLCKEDDFDDFISKYSLDAEEILYMGDDIPDYNVMKMVGMPTCPANATPEIQSISRYVSGKNGGDGCVRDVIEQVLRAREKWITIE